MRAYYSWKVENPSDALHDVMVDVQEQSEYVHIGWNEEAEKNAQEVLVNDTSNQASEKTLESPLYGAMVGIDRGRNEFELSYTYEKIYDNVTTVTWSSSTGSAVQHTGLIVLPLLAAFVVLVCNYF